ncbi:hypothetical protein PIB30_004024 [Stylosanthes scabra]|uniref:Uncharacterized protein n=1 Tax=Stylosanthes scabra TaxID=79078 RepID=A0ABU6X247_9FABA|nr:hypothetical protein [Stylosanthes scabra]
MRRARAGQPRMTRIRVAMDDADPNRPRRCGLCRETGHTRKICPQRCSTAARLFHSNHMSQSYLYHLTFTPFLELTMSLSLLFIVLGSANLNPWQGATDPVQFQATIGESMAFCHGLVHFLQGATDSIETWNGAI